MKIPYIYIAGGAALLLSLSACDNINEDERLIPVPRPHTDRTVLIEEFTGANCPNCPDGAAQVAALHEQYGDNVIPVSLYPSNAGSLTNPVRPFPVDLRTELASTYYSAFNVENLPAAMFNRTLVNGRYFSNSIATWGSPVSELLKTTSPVEISMEGSYDASSRNLTVSYDTHFVDAYEGEVSFQLWVLENNIMSSQSSTSGLIVEYTNNHVLRASMNGTWGTAFTDRTAYLPEDHVSGENSITLESGWVAEECQVVGFLFNTKTREVIQAYLLKSILPEANAK